MVSLRAVVQKVDSPVSFQFHPDHPAAACTVFPGRPAASAASAGQDVVLRQSAARLRESFQELVRDSPLASVERARQDALRARQVRQPPGAQLKVAFPMEPLAVVPKALVAARQVQLPAALSPMAVGSV